MSQEAGQLHPSVGGPSDRHTARRLPKLKLFERQKLLSYYREMEMEYTSMAASVERRLSHQSSEDGGLPEGTTSVTCPICDVTEMQADKGNVCVECERFVCHSCGSFEMSQNTKVRYFSYHNYCQPKRITKYT